MTVFRYRKSDLIHNSHLTTYQLQSILGTIHHFYLYILINILDMLHFSCDCKP